MDRFQALSLIGFDGPDSSSPPDEIKATIDRMEGAPKPHHPDLTAEISRLRKLLAQAESKATSPR